MKWHIRGAQWILLAYSLFIIILTHIPSSDLPSIPRFNDKIVHGTMYGIWGIIACFAAKPRTALRWLLSGILLALGDELTQPYFDRHLDIWDWCADCCGLLLGYGLTQLSRNIIATNHTPKT